MRCLVTGVAGFVGSNLAERPLANDHDVCVVEGFRPVVALREELVQEFEYIQSLDMW